jgi:hypothetical protein
MTLTTSQIERIETEIAQYAPEVQEFYRSMVANGQSPRFAIMAALHKAPDTRHTDRTFTASRHKNFEAMSPKIRARYLELAKQAGISTQGKFYVGGLGRPTDPMAWVSTVDDAKEVCKRKNLNAEGLVSHQAHEEPYKKVRMAPDIKQAIVAERISRDPALAAKCAKSPHVLRQLEAEVVDRHAKPCTT